MTFPIIPASTVNGAYQISRSLRFRSSASAYLSRTPASAGNRKTWTWSGWVKRGALSSNQVIFACGSSYTTNTYFTFYFGSDNTLVTSTGTAEIWRTTAAYRDPSAFYHLVLVVDTNNATANNRTRLWVNGSEVTNFTRGTNLSLSTDYGVNDTVIHYLGRDFSGVYLDGYLAEVNFLDGYPTVGGTTYDATTWAALNVATLFGAYDTNGVWQPARYTGTYGTNGFYLPFTDTTSTTTLVADSSGNGNNWTPNNISLTAGVTYDSMIDSPTNYADGGNGRGNYPVLNPLIPSTGATVITYSNGNLTATSNSGSPATESGAYSSITIPANGKFYAELTVVTALGSGSNSWPRFGAAGYDMGIGGYVNFGGSSYGTFANGDVMRVAVDTINGRIWWGKNNTWLNSGDPAAGTGYISTFTYSSGISFDLILYSVSSASSGSINFGQRPFSYTPPSGFSALNTQNLPAPALTPSP